MVSDLSKVALALDYDVDAALEAIDPTDRHSPVSDPRKSDAGGGSTGSTSVSMVARPEAGRGSCGYAAVYSAAMSRPCTVSAQITSDVDRDDLSDQNG